MWSDDRRNGPVREKRDRRRKRIHGRGVSAPVEDRPRQPSRGGRHVRLNRSTFKQVSRRFPMRRRLRREPKDICAQRDRRRISSLLRAGANAARGERNSATGRHRHGGCSADITALGSTRSAVRTGRGRAGPTGSPGDSSSANPRRLSGAQDCIATSKSREGHSFGRLVAAGAPNGRWPLVPRETRRYLRDSTASTRRPTRHASCSTQ